MILCLSACDWARFRRHKGAVKRYPQLDHQGWSLSNLAARLQLNRLTHRDLWAWLDEPFAVGVAEPPGRQLSFVPCDLDSIGSLSAARSRTSSPTVIPNPNSGSTVT